MNILKKITLTLFMVLNFIVVYSQTPINGLINSDTILKKANSPFFVESNLVLYPNNEMTIEAGVEIQFAKGVSLEIRGTLIAKGTKTDSITFTSNSSTEKNSWQGINVKKIDNGKAFFEYCNFKYASTAVNEECCHNTEITIKHSSFITNRTALGGYSGGNTPVDSCYFYDNTYCLTSADKTVSNSIFDNNEYGLYSTERTSVSNSTFTNHTEIAIFGRGGTISNCVIKNNNIGIKSSGFTIKNNVISTNDIGLELTNNSPLDSNQICSNTTYNIKNNQQTNLDAYTNCFCENDSTIIENKIFDAYDDNNKGLVNYNIFDQTCNSVTLKVDKGAIKLASWVLAKSPYIITKDFLIPANDTLYIEPGVEVRFENGISLDVRGVLLAKGTITDSITFTSNSSTEKNSWQGINVKKIDNGKAFFEYCNFKYASTAVNEECCHNTEITIKHSSFITNRTALGGYSGGNTPVDSCYFYDNTYCLTSADKTVSNSIFDNNEYGLYSTERTSVSNSTFTNHTEIAIFGQGGTISNCVIKNNNIGIKSSGFTIKNNVISTNDIGLELTKSSPLDSNQICNNTTYNIKNNQQANLDSYTNCFCENDSTIIEDKIFDAYDDINKGLVNYNIYNQTCDSLISKIDKSIIKLAPWVLAKSPYIITKSFVIYPHDTLYIEPGVEARFENGVSIIVKGVLLAKGTETDSITFTSNSSTEKNSWQGINVKSTDDAKAFFEYCNFKYASTAVNEECCHNTEITIKHSSFITNRTALGGYSGGNTPVDSCYFYDNTYCLTSADKTVSNSIFDNNEYGLYSTERTSVFNSTFTNHTEIALYGRGGTISNCVIKNNNIGIKSSGFTIKNNIISTNDIGLELTKSSPLDSNQICSNTTYNIKNNNQSNIEVYTNCFCESDSTIIEDKIFDGYDDNDKGLVDYVVFSDDCSIPLVQYIKTQDKVIDLVVITDNQNIVLSELKVFPNPTTRIINILGASKLLTEVKIYDYSGTLQLIENFYNQENIQLDLNELNNGIYFIEINQNGETFRKKIMKLN